MGSASIPDSVNEHIANCRGVIESLRAEGPLSDEEHAAALQTLGSQGGADIPLGKVPKQGSLLILRANIPEELAGADLLRTICRRFNIVVEKRELEFAKAELEVARQKTSIVNWLGALTDRLSHGIGDGTYEVLPQQPHPQPLSKESTEINSAVFGCLRSLLHFSPQENDIIWSDDRFINGYFRRDTIPIVGINEILEELRRKEIINPECYYDHLLKLRAANARFIPVSKDEILHQLSHAIIKDGRVVETRALSILRRYIAACLHGGAMLQRPPMPEGTPNVTGELVFVLGLLRAVNDSVIEVWEKQGDDVNACRAKGNWLIENFYFDHLGALKTLSMQRAQEDEKYVVALGLVGLLAHAFGFSSYRNLNEIPARQNYFSWLSDRVLKKRFDADPDLIFGVAECLKNLMQETKELAEKNGPPDMVAKLLHLYYYELPGLIKDEIAKDSDFMAGIGIKVVAINEIGGLKFDANDLWPAIAEAINGQTARLRTVDSKLLIVFHPSENVEGIGEFYFKDPTASKRRTAKDDLFGILSDSPSFRETVLRRNRRWFDCPTEVFEKAVGVIVTTEDVRQRIEETLRWRNSSAWIYYEKVLQMAADHQEFQSTEVLPPSGDGLLRHFRFQADLYPDIAFKEITDRAAQSILREEGLFEAIDRLSGLPVPLPETLIYAIADLTLEKMHRAIAHLIRAAQSPVSKMHLIRILVRLSDKIPAYWRIAHQVAINLLCPQGLQECEAFSTLLRWMVDEFGYWHDARQWPVPMRLAMVWAHSHKLFCIFRSVGAPASWIHETFESAGHRLPPELFERHPDSWFDIAHPHRSNTEGLLLTGLAYGFSGNTDRMIHEKLKNLLGEMAGQVIQGNSLPKFALLRDPKLAGNCLGSFLALDRGLAFDSLLKDEIGQTFKSESLVSSLHDALDRIVAGSDQTLAFDWALVQSIIGDLPPPQDCVEKIKKCLYQIDLVVIFEKDPFFGGLVIQTLCSQVGNLHDEDLRLYMEGQLFRVIEHIAKTPKALGNQLPDGTSDEKTKINVVLLESALGLALAIVPKGSAAAEFRRIVIKMIEACREPAQQYRPIIQRLCEELPLAYAKDLWPLLIRLRAEA